MKRKKKIRRSYQLSTYVSPEEYEKVMERYKSTTFRSQSEFFRNRLINRPETVFYRNQSVDDFLYVAIGLKNELMSISKEFGKAIAILQGVREGPEAEAATSLFETKLFVLEVQMEEIKLRLIQIYEQWSRK
jgi:hypothetical protein